MILLLYEHVRVPVVVFFLFVRVCAARNKHASGTVCNVVFVFFGGVLLGPIAGAAVSIPFSASLKMCIVCKHTEDVLRNFVLSSTATSALKIG